MLKKLIKYGNSTALVLDRAILELLNMKEGALVKLKTDGVSLIITPEFNEPAHHPFVSNNVEAAAHILQNALADTPLIKCSPLETALNAKVKKNVVRLSSDSIEKAAFENCLPGTENFDKLGEVVKKIMDKYKDEVKKLSSPEAFNALNELSDKYKGNATCDEYLQEVCALRLHYAPLLANMDAELLQAQREIQGLTHNNTI